MKGIKTYTIAIKNSQATEKLRHAHQTKILYSFQSKGDMSTSPFVIVGTL